MRVQLVGLDKLERKLGVNFAPAMKGATKAIAAEIQGEIAPYPSSTLANSPSQQRWYERGYGPKWRRRDGSVGGVRSSETLGRRWGIKKSGRIGSVLGNIASYSPFVHSAEEQAGFHGRRGWVTDKAAIAKVVKSGTVQKIVRDAIRHALRRAGR